MNAGGLAVPDKTIETVSEQAAFMLLNEKVLVELIHVFAGRLVTVSMLWQS